MFKRNKNRVKYTLSEKIVHFLATLLTLFWMFMLFFPIYWCVITSMKDPADALLEPPSFVPTTPYEYDVVLEYTPEQWNGIKSDTFKEDANVITWTGFFNSANARMGICRVYAVVDGEVEASATLRRSTYTLRYTQIWDQNLKLSAESIIDRIDKAEEIGCLSYKNVSKLPKTNQTNDITLTLTEAYEECRDNLHGTVKSVSVRNNIWTFAENYIAAWDYPISLGIEGGLPKAVFNSMKISMGAVLGNWVVCGLAGYALSKLMPKRMGRKALLLFFLTSMVPSTVTTVATYLILEKIGLATSFWGVILPMIANASNIMLFKGFFDGIHNDLCDAARLDGCNDLSIFGRICLPLSKPIFMTIGLLTFPVGFNDFFWSMLILRERQQFTVPLVSKILLQASGGQASYTMMMAFGLIISIPSILMMIIGQKDLNKGMNFSGLKG